MLNRVVRKPSLYDIFRQTNGKLSIGRFGNLPDMSINQSLTPSAAFLGPHADNHAVLSELAHRAMDSLINFRTEVWKGPEIKQDIGHQTSVDALKLRFQAFLKFMEDHSTPFSSLRYLAHMTGDQLLPAVAAYYAGMIYNSNNVTIQASTATTLLEMLVMRDLCDMIAFTRQAVFYNQADDIAQYCSDPWAHIASDGSIANIEAMWAAREAKALPFAAMEALKNEPGLAAAVGITVTTCDNRVIELMSAKPWALWNLTRDERLALPYRIAELTDLEDYEVWSILAHYDINAQGWQAFTRYFHGHGWPVVLVPSTAHYSWPKAAGVLGLGTSNIQHVMVDKYGRMKMDKLCARLDAALDKKQPVLMTVSVYGSTEESAVDPLTDILTIRDEYRKKGLDFDIHVDAAWGGYFIATIRKSFNMDNIPTDKRGIDQLALLDPFLDDTREVLLSDYVIGNTKAIRFADSVTIDPHKMGYVQYPAGTILYNNGNVINLTTFTGSYIGTASDPTVGLFGLEGSRPGAAAAAVYFTHACLRPDHEGYGKIIARSLYNTKQFYAELMFMGHQDQYKTALLMPSDAPEALVKDQILRKRLAEIRSEPAVLDIFKKLGPDQNIVDYGFNPVIEGQLNTDVAIYNDFITKVYDTLRIRYDKQAVSDDNVTTQPELMLSMTTFKPQDYGEEFIMHFAEQLGLEVSADNLPGLNCLRSTIMSPFTSDINDPANQDSYWPTIIKTLGGAVASISPLLPCS